MNKTSVSVGLAHLRTNNYLLDARLGTSGNRLSEFQVGINHGRRIGGAFVNVDLGMQNGIGAFRCAKRRDQERDPTRAASPTPNYRKPRHRQRHLQPFTLWGESFSFSSLATGRRSEDVLFSPERISLGGSASVRGFKDQQLTGDSSGYWRNDVHFGAPDEQAGCARRSWIQRQRRLRPGCDPQ